MSEFHVSPQEDRENPDPYEGTGPVPWPMLALVALLFAFCIVYIIRSDIETPSLWGDGRDSAELTGAKESGKVDGAALGPRPVQSPRPPILIAGMGPVMLGHTARYADIWNSISFAKTFEEQLAETRSRVATLDAKCAAIGRDPASLRRSYLMFDAAARQSGGRVNYYESEESFTRLVDQVIALGITEIGLYYPIATEQKPVFERIARNVLPAMKAAHRAPPSR